MIIQVKQKHIKNGKRHSSCNCAFALAVKETTGKPVVFVTDRVEIIEQETHPFNCKNYKCSKKIFNFIDKFDKGMKVKPGSFRLVKYVADWERNK